ncbi:unnamed protein product [Clonostachys rhizophaga]|uniref:Cytochrome P450 n=1 Tax=Clonostachys rhizophaga TaxID=160324 RepID=A0A9N9W078_9HYPO|nr:unnamed protein product [Clonostachys rhizophaga]
MLVLSASLWSLLLPLIVAISLLEYGRRAIRSKSLPPGPSTCLFIGICYTSTKWAGTYRSMLGLKLGPQNLIVLNSANLVRDLFDKRGAIYSSRTPSHIGNELITRDNTHLLLMPYGQAWRNQRKVYQSILNITAVVSLQPLQAAEAVLTMSQLIESPEKYYDHIRRYSTAVILSSVFGIRGPNFNHPNIQRLYHVQDQFTAILETGATPPIDIFPFLKHLPTFLAPWRRWALSIRAEQRQLYFELLDNAKSRIQRGVHRKCFMDDILGEAKPTKFALDDEHIAYIGGVLMEGGSDTTASTLLSFLMAMMKHPEVLRKAQKEVDEICGLQRSPNFEDVGKLTYVRQCMTEVRWCSPFPLTRPNSYVDVEMASSRCRRYSSCVNSRRYLSRLLLPKGINVYSEYLVSRVLLWRRNSLIWCCRAIHHDPEVYDRPEEFRPERYEGNEFGFKSDPQDPSSLRKTYAFGAGRRICPGQHLAENSLLINMAKLVWTFNLLPGRDFTTGKQLSISEIDDSIATAWTNGFLTAPKKFPLSLVVRSREHEQIIRRECLEAEEVFKNYQD